MTTPYFYIIEHITTKRKYAGCKWARNSTPDNFMRVGGYTTSSTEVNNIILSEGISAFRVVTIKTELECGMHVYEYETRWLNDHDCAKSKTWINKHNNSNSIGLISVTEELKIKRSANRTKFLSTPEGLAAGTEGLIRNSKSEQFRKRRSDDSTGEKNHFYGKRHTAETKQLISKMLVGREVWNDGLTKEECSITMQSSIRMKLDNPIHKMSKDAKDAMYKTIGEKQKGKRWFHNPLTLLRLFVFPGQESEGFIPGMGKVESSRKS